MAEIKPEGCYVGVPKKRYDFVLKLIDSKSTTRGYHVHNFMDRENNHFLMFGDESLYALPHIEDEDDLMHKLRKGDVFKVKATINRHNINTFSNGPNGDPVKENVINRPKFGQYLGNLNESHDTEKEETI